MLPYASNYPKYRWLRALLLSLGSLFGFTLSFLLLWLALRDPNLEGDMSLLIYFVMLLWTPFVPLLLGLLDRLLDKHKLHIQHPALYSLGGCVVGSFSFYPGFYLVIAPLYNLLNWIPLLFKPHSNHQKSR